MFQSLTNPRLVHRIVIVMMIILLKSRNKQFVELGKSCPLNLRNMHQWFVVYLILLPEKGKLYLV